jgi:Zn-finger nucleic acid-binding protein
MPRQAKPIDVECPCCHAVLRVDSETGAVLTCTEKEKPKTFQDFTEAVDRFKGEAGRREEAFQKSVQDHKQHKDVLAKKFDELFKKAKEDPDAPPPKRAFDFD